MAAVYLGHFRRSVVVDSIARRQSGEFATDCGSQMRAAQTVVLAADVVDIEPELPNLRAPSVADRSGTARSATGSR